MPAGLVGRPLAGPWVRSLPRPSARATRLPFEMEMRYRLTEPGGWHACRTVNVSRTGVLFAAADEPPVGHPIEFVLQLAAGPGRAESRDLSCRGTLVRAHNSSGGAWHVAATIATYELTTSLEGK